MRSNSEVSYVLAYKGDVCTLGKSSHQHLFVTVLNRLNAALLILAEWSGGSVGGELSSNPEPTACSASTATRP